LDAPAVRAALFAPAVRVEVAFVAPRVLAPVRVAPVVARRDAAVAREVVVFAALRAVVVFAAPRAVVGAALVASAAEGAAVSPRVVRESAARALPAAVCSPFAFVAFAAATRARAALAAAARPVVRLGLATGTSDSPPKAALIFNISRLFRRAAALRWIDPFLAARSSADTA
jgi:hypothetical protein